MAINAMLIILTCLIMINCDLIPERVVIVDKNTKLKNYFIRGNLPIQNNHFQIQQLKNRLSEITGLKKYKLIIISMLNFLTPKQTKNRYIQQIFFQEHPQQGEYRHKIILGSLIDPFQIPSILRPILGYFSQYIFDIDQIDEFITSINGEINGGESKKIIYLHCSAGMDRTGYVSGSYKLKYLKANLGGILQENSKFGGDRTEMHFNALNGLKWSCLKYRNERQCLKSYD